MSLARMRSRLRPPRRSSRPLTDPRNAQSLQRAADQDPRDDRARRRADHCLRRGRNRVRQHRLDREKEEEQAQARRPASGAAASAEAARSAAGRGRSHAGAADPRAPAVLPKPTSRRTRCRAASSCRSAIRSSRSASGLGTFLLKPSIDVTRGYDTNPERTLDRPAFRLHRRRAGAEGPLAVVGARGGRRPSRHLFVVRQAVVARPADAGRQGVHALRRLARHHLQRRGPLSSCRPTIRAARTCRPTSPSCRSSTPTARHSA